MRIDQPYSVFAYRLRPCQSNCIHLSMCASGLALLCSAAYAQNFVYVANQVSGSVTVIDGPTNAVVQTIPVSPAPWQMAVNPDAMRVYVSLASQNPVNKAV